MPDQHEIKLYLPYLFDALHRARFAGTLKLQEGQIERVVFLHEGQPVQVQSRLQEETLGRVLLDEKKITPEQYQEMLQRIIQTRRPAGEILIAMGVMGPQDVFAALEFQARKRLNNCFKMKDFGFSLEAKPVPPEHLIVHLNIAEVIFSGIRVAYSLDRLLSEFPVDEDTVFMAPQDRTLPPLGPKDERVYRAVKSGTALSRLMKLQPDIKALVTTLYALHALRLIEASGIARPSVRDLELPGLEDDAPVTIPSAEQAAAGPDSEPPAVEPAAEDFSAPTLVDMERFLKVNPLLAEKCLVMGREDHFALLGVSRQERGQGLRAAYFRLLRTYHLQDIDRYYQTIKEREMAHQLLDRATLAYRELDDAQSREAYLASLASRTARSEAAVPVRVRADVEAQKGELFLAAKRFDAAIDAFQQAIAMYPEDPGYHYRLGLGLYHRESAAVPADQPLPESVIEPLLKALTIDPRFSPAHLQLGYFFKRNRAFDRALAHFRKALECDPTCKPAQSESRYLEKEKS
ncbi:MAG: hypothetical protein GYA21_00905 [Myxococcales bacterium]|nr:hypothetical protein [Myxococcales bacterium]